MDENVVKLLQQLEHEDPNMRWIAAGELGSCKLEKKDKGAVVDALIKRLEKEKTLEVREVIVFTLGEMGGKKAVDALIERLKKDESIYVREAAARRLGKIGSPKAFYPLIEALEDPYSDMCGTAAEALGNMADKGKLGKTKLKKVVDALTKLQEARSQYVREKTKEALEKIRKVEDALELIKTLKATIGRGMRITNDEIAEKLYLLIGLEAVLKLRQIIYKCWQSCEPLPDDRVMYRMAIGALEGKLEKPDVVSKQDLRRAREQKKIPPPKH